MLKCKEASQSVIVILLKDHKILMKEVESIARLSSS